MKSHDSIDWHYLSNDKWGCFCPMVREQASPTVGYQEQDKARENLDLAPERVGRLGCISLNAFRKLLDYASTGL